MADIKQVADAADMIVNGYAFTRCTEGYRVLNLNRPDRAAGHELRRAAGSLRALHPDDEGHHPHRDQPHRGHREAERRFSPEPFAGF